MADLHHEVLALIEAGPRRVMDLSLDSIDPSRQETPEEFARRCVLRAVELEREECAKVCDAYREDVFSYDLEEYDHRGAGARDCADAIRRRGKP